MMQRVGVLFLILVFATLLCPRGAQAQIRRESYYLDGDMLYTVFRGQSGDYFVYLGEPDGIFWNALRWQAATQERVFDAANPNPSVYVFAHGTGDGWGYMKGKHLILVESERFAEAVRALAVGCEAKDIRFLSCHGGPERWLRSLARATGRDVMARRSGSEGILYATRRSAFINTTACWYTPPVELQLSTPDALIRRFTPDGRVVAEPQCSLGMCGGMLSPEANRAFLAEGGTAGPMPYALSTYGHELLGRPRSVLEERRPRYRPPIPASPTAGLDPAAKRDVRRIGRFGFERAKELATLYRSIPRDVRFDSSLHGSPIVAALRTTGPMTPWVPKTAAELAALEVSLTPFQRASPDGSLELVSAGMSAAELVAIYWDE